MSPRSNAGRRILLAGSVFVFLLAAAGGSPAQDAGTEPDLTPEQLEAMMREPPSHLAAIPPLPFDSAPYEPTAEERREIEALIAALTSISEPDYGLAPWMSGTQFAPVPSSRSFGAGIIMVDHGLSTSSAVARLVELGPKAMPALLEALVDAAPTSLVMEHRGGMGGMWYGREIATNAAHTRERQVVAAHAGIVAPGRDLGGLDDHIQEHAVTRGDVCFLIIGQIVNRGYQPTRYQPTACRVINSPTQDPEIAAIVREVWTSDDPARTLFESLMTDLHTRGGAAAVQTGAAMRLLYYFPEASRDLIVARLDAFDVRRLAPGTDLDARRVRHEMNGDVRVAGFVEAVAFADDPAITAALLRIAERTDDPTVFAECLTEAVAAAGPDMVRRRMADLVAVAPPAGQGPFGGEHHVLRTAARLFPEASGPLFERYLEHGTLECRRAVIHALRKPAAAIPWAAGLLEPLLDDRTDTGWRYGPAYDRKPIRVCDEAATTLVAHVEGATFDMKGETSDLDRQIENIRRRLAGEPIVETAAGEEAAAPIDFAALPRVEPDATFELDEQIGGVYDFSDERTLYAGLGHRADGWASDTVTVDVATGTITGRTRLDEWKGGVSIVRPIGGSRALCYHGYEGGHVAVRDLRTGEELSRLETPFHDGVSFDDPWQVRNLQDLFASGDGRWLVAITTDGALHALSVETGEHRQVWRREGETRLPFLRGSLVPVAGTNRFLIEFFGEDDPLRVWDQDAQEMTEILKVPDGGWRSAWGRYACNRMNNRLAVWDLEARTPLDLPLPEGAPIRDVLADGDQSALFVATVEGPVYVLDLETVRPIGRLEPPPAEGRVSMKLASDDRLLVWTCDLTNRDRETGQRSNRRTAFALFDVAVHTR